mmetsp:Transcript_43800/g.92089  ORF Transcript_43800/g.92089 Transcript_43800/m.92089 type:complete len:83 (-) Transcript_43800:43-291(-)
MVSVKKYVCGSPPLLASSMSRETVVKAENKCRYQCGRSVHSMRRRIHTAYKRKGCVFQLVLHPHLNISSKSIVPIMTIVHAE